MDDQEMVVVRKTGDLKIKTIKNKEIILSGILCGVIGYAIGNFLGIAIGRLLM